MLENCKTKEERHDGVEQLVNRWLTERQELIVLYCSLAGNNTFSPDCSQSIGKLRKFCEILLDYVSAGHFEVYDQLVREAEAFNDGTETLLEALYPQLRETTEIALSFNDTYDSDEHCQQAMGDLKDRLSHLGEVMDQRFALEDELIQVLHKSHEPAKSLKTAANA
ncbi:Regulator of sigma D [BD1-7 clade bacterium]|uniref:Regulator of sigma D n=1 Tax=BD1-7 clade bacterium TaxID=2029982 RepID=A0A5S9QG28_9GAMM|nr:Regulator of sigma D [BD1-7 clade bacterium]